MRSSLVALSLLLAPLAHASAHDRVRLEVGLPHLAVGLRTPALAAFVQVPGLPVAYDSRVASNVFWFDDRYWELRDDGWLAASAGGPWRVVAPEHVPLPLLQVPVRYDRRPPAAFVGWRLDEAPRWSEHWGHARHGRHGGDDGWRGEHGGEGGRHGGRGDHR